MSGPQKLEIARGLPSPLGPVGAPMPAVVSTNSGSANPWQRVKAALQAFTAPVISPMNPIAPMVDTQTFGPRQFQYQSGVNLNTVPRAEEGRTPFHVLINLADMLDSLNMALLYRAEEVASLDWQIMPRDDKHPPSDAQISEAYVRLQRPDGDARTGQWFSALTWDSYVTDAASVYLPRSRAGDVLSWDLLEGACIKPLLLGNGRRPSPPIPAYQQILYGRPFWEGTTQDLIYAPKNPRVNSAYGHSPVEMVLMTINRILRRQVFDLAYYKDGNIPDTLIPAPADWSQDQIDKMQVWFDTIVNAPENRRKAHFIPSARGTINAYEFKQPILDTLVEEYLDKRIFAIIGVTPQMLGFANQANKATAYTEENVSQGRLMPFIRFLSALISDLLLLSGLPDCVVQFAGEKPDEDKLAKAQVHDIYLKNGVMSVEDAQADIQLTSSGQRYLYTATGAVKFPPPDEPLQTATPTPPDDTRQAAPGTATSVSGGAEGASGEDAAGANSGAAENPDNAETVARRLAELDQWERRVKRHGVGGRRFVCRSIDGELADAIQTLLEESPGDARTVFAQARVQAAADDVRAALAVTA